MSTAYIIAAVRTPQGKLLGALASQSAPQLAAHAIRRAIELSQVSAFDQAIDHVILGNVVSAGVGQAPARQAATLAGLSNSIGAITINKVCGSGLASVMLADMAIRAGEYHTVVAGGMESMSQAPHLLAGSRHGIKYGSAQLIDALDSEGLNCAHLKQSMGCIAEQVARSLNIDRQSQDAWALRSHQRAIAAQQSGRFASEVVPIAITVGKQSFTCQIDEPPRAECSLESLARLSPAFAPQGSVTAGNASSLADGAAAVVVVDDAALKKLNPDWAFRIVGHATVAGPHTEIFTAPARAVQALLHKTGRQMSDVDLLEINEAFAVQTIACMDALHADEAKVNVNGGAIALGHPLGASGARVLVTLIHELVARRQSIGIATLCLGGGEAVALMIERV